MAAKKRKPTMSAARDHKLDREEGIKQGSAMDRKLDRMHGLPASASRPRRGKGRK